MNTPNPAPWTYENGFVALNESSPNFPAAVKLLAWKRGIGTEGTDGAGI